MFRNHVDDRIFASGLVSIETLRRRYLKTRHNAAAKRNVALKQQLAGSAPDDHFC